MGRPNGRIHHTHRILSLPKLAQGKQLFITRARLRGSNAGCQIVLNAMFALNNGIYPRNLRFAQQNYGFTRDIKIQHRAREGE